MSCMFKKCYNKESVLANMLISVLLLFSPPCCRFLYADFSCIEWHLLQFIIIVIILIIPMEWKPVTNSYWAFFFFGGVGGWFLCLRSSALPFIIYHYMPWFFIFFFFCFIALSVPGLGVLELNLCRLITDFPATCGSAPPILIHIELQRAFCWVCHQMAPCVPHTAVLLWPNLWKEAHHFYYLCCIWWWWFQYFELICAYFMFIFIFFLWLR